MTQLATVVDTSVSQPLPDRLAFEPPIFGSKPYHQLKINDEINAYCGRTYRRCRVISCQVEGDYIRLTLSLVSRANSKDVTQQRFLAGALAEVYRDRSPQPKTQFDRYSEKVLGAIEPGEIYTTSEISIRLRIMHELCLAKGTVGAICKEFCRRGVLSERRVRSGNILSYRRDLPHSIGLPVVEFAGRGSERLGWVIEWRYFRATNSQQPIVHWLDGSETFSSEERLDPPTAEQRQQIEVAKRQALGLPFDGPVEISEWLLLELRQSWGEQPRQARNDVMVHIAKLLGYLPDAASDFQGVSKSRAWNQTLTYLDRYYPDWQQGRAA